MSSKETLEKLNQHLTKTKSSIYSLATRIQEILPLTTEKMTHDTAAALESLLDDMDEMFPIFNQELITNRDELKKPVEGS